jgi:hypothetical protein
MFRPHLIACAVCTILACQGVFAQTAPAGAKSSPRIKIALIMPAEDSALAQPAQWAADGLIAANYASKGSASLISVRPKPGATVMDQLNEAAKAGAMIAVGPLDRAGVEQIASQPFLPLPVVTLNQVPLSTEVPDTEPEAGAAEQPSVQPPAETAPASALEKALAKAKRNLGFSAGSTEPAPGTIRANTDIQGFVKAEDIPVRRIKKLPKIFPRELLMMGLSMEREAEYITGLALKALPERTSSGEKPKVLILDHNTPLEKRISDAFLFCLQEAGFRPDRMTVDHANLEPALKMFSLELKGKQAKFPEEPILKENDPVGYAQQQLRMKKFFAERRAEVAFAEPPYAAIFLAMGNQTAPIIKPRLPSRSRVWATSAVYPGDPDTDLEAKSMCFDLQNIGLAGAPFVLGYDAEAFVKRYKILPISGVLQKRLFALGSDALKVALAVVKGQNRYSFKGENGQISFDRAVAPAVKIIPTPAMIQPGSIRLMKEQEIIEFNVIDLYESPLQRRDESKAAAAGKTPAVR